MFLLAYFIAGVLAFGVFTGLFVGLAKAKSSDHAPWPVHVFSFIGALFWPLSLPLVLGYGLGLLFARLD